jgi:hypothetical protein
VEENSVVDESGLETDSSERQDDLDVLASLAASERARVDLVVARFEILAIFGEEGEGDLGPEGVAPVGTDEEGHGGDAVGLDGLDGEEEVVGGSAFEIMHGCVKTNLPTATSGTVAKA